MQAKLEAFLNTYKRRIQKRLKKCRRGTPHCFTSHILNTARTIQKSARPSPYANGIELFSSDIAHRDSGSAGVGRSQTELTHEQARECGRCFVNERSPLEVDKRGGRTYEASVDLA